MMWAAGFKASLVANGLLLVWAQTTPDPISGASGWVGAGLLGLVLAWLLFFHLPAKDKQLKDFVEAKDEHVKELAAIYEHKMAMVTETFKHDSEARWVRNKDALDAVLAHCRDEGARNVEVFKSEVKRLVDSYESRKQRSA